MYVAALTVEFPWEQLCSLGTVGIFVESGYSGHNETVYVITRSCTKPSVFLVGAYLHSCSAGQILYAKDISCLTHWIVMSALRNDLSWAHQGSKQSLGGNSFCALTLFLPQQVH